MTNFDRFKRLRPGASGELETPKSKFNNPYSKPAPQTKIEEAKQEKVPEDSILGGPNKSLYQQLYMQSKEIKELKEDIASLYCMLMGEDDYELTEQEARERYMIFKTNKKHLINRKVKKF